MKVAYYDYHSGAACFRDDVQSIDVNTCYVGEDRPVEVVVYLNVGTTQPPVSVRVDESFSVEKVVASVHARLENDWLDLLHLGRQQ